MLLNPNFNGDIGDYSRYTEHISAYHSYINNNNSMASNEMGQLYMSTSSIINNGNREINAADDINNMINNNYKLINMKDEIGHCNNLLPFTPIISELFLFNSTPQIIAKYITNKFDPKSLKTIKTNLSQYKITDFGLYKSNIICSIGKRIKILDMQN